MLTKPSHNVPAPEAPGKLELPGGTVILLVNWEAIKKTERKARGDGRKSALDGIAPALPALAKAQKMGARAERTGFKWNTPGQRSRKVREELREVLTAENDQHRFEEFGDLLFTIAVLANGYEIDAESALREACAKFARRFHAVEHLSDDRGLDMKQMNLRALLKLWNEAKSALG